MHIFEESFKILEIFLSPLTKTQASLKLQIYWVACS